MVCTSSVDRVQYKQNLEEPKPSKLRVPTSAWRATDQATRWDWISRCQFRVSVPNDNNRVYGCSCRMNRAIMVVVLRVGVKVFLIDAE